MITLTTPTQQAMARIAAAPATSEQGRRTLPTRLAMAACPMPSRCPAPCETCSGVARNVAGELAQILRERHGSSQVADWLEGMQP